MKLMIPITFLMIAIAACTTILFVSALKPTSIGAFVFVAVWLTFPYAIMSAALILLQRKGTASFHWYIVAVIVSIGGILFLADVIFWHPDAQGAIAVLMTPILQGGASALLLPIVWWVSRNVRTYVTAIIFITISLAASLSIAEDDYVTFAKSLLAKDYDNSLPSLPIEQWITSHGIVAVWNSNVTGCGEQTGDPAIDKERDMPMCVEIELKENGKSVGYLLLFIGTEKKGKLKKSARLYYGYIKQNEKTVTLKTLSDLTKKK